MKINFILPGYSIIPVGGFKVMYEYASRLAMIGYDVMIYHVLTLSSIKYQYPACFRIIRAKFIYKDLPSWYKFSSDTKSVFIPTISDKYIRDADIIMSTQWTTALEVFNLSISKGKKIDFIQGYETWIGNDNDGLYKSYKLPIKHIVVSDYLSDIVYSISGKKPSVIYNAIDNNVFYITKPIKDRNPFEISMLYSEQKLKGNKYGIEALTECKKIFPMLHVKMFGVYKKCKYENEWITYYKCPNNLCELYNSTSIFLTTSLKEGWGLPATEAMSCGCALICTNVEGHTVFAKNDQTALLVAPKDVMQTVVALTSLLNDNELRLSLASRGNAYVQQFNWNYAINKMEEILKKVSKE